MADDTTSQIEQDAIQQFNRYLINSHSVLSELVVSVRTLSDCVIGLNNTIITQNDQQKRWITDVTETLNSITKYIDEHRILQNANLVVGMRMN
jgi:hypothetical protein